MMHSSDVKRVRDEALREIGEELFRDEVEAAKERIRARRNRPLWHRLFPWKITITRR